MKDPLHILFISSWYPNRNDPTLGIFNRYFALAVSGLNNVSVLNISSEFKVADESEVSSETQDGILTLNVYYKKMTAGFPLISQFVRRQRVLDAAEIGFKKLLELKGKPDLIHINVAMPMGIPAIHLAEKFNIPYVVNENWSGYAKEDGQYKGFIQTYFTGKIIAGAKAILPTSIYLRDAMLSHGLKGNYQVVPNVVDINVFKPNSTSKKLRTRFIHISSLNDREKNVSGILRAFIAALKINPKMDLVIVGEGIDKKSYEQIVSEAKVQDQIFFTGRLFGQDLVREINNSDALVMFSNFETFCLVIIEAFACGKPVITSAAGAIPSYMRPELGKVVPVKDEAALTKAFFDFAKNSSEFNADTIRNFAVENYSYEKVGETLNEIYRLALKKEN